MAEKENPHAKYYQIVVRGHLKPDLHPWLDGMHIQNFPSGEAVLSGSVVDQAMLHGLLIKIRDIGLPLISVNSIGSTNQDKERKLKEHKS